MTYGYTTITTDGKRIFHIEGCTYCFMSTGGQHETNCPYGHGKQEYPIDLDKLPDKENK